MGVGYFLIKLICQEMDYQFHKQDSASLSKKTFRKLKLSLTLTLSLRKRSLNSWSSNSGNCCISSNISSNKNAEIRTLMGSLYIEKIRTCFQSNSIQASRFRENWLYTALSVLKLSVTTFLFPLCKRSQTFKVHRILKWK